MAAAGLEFRELAEARELLRSVTVECARDELAAAEAIVLGGLREYSVPTALAVVDAAAAVVLARSLEQLPTVACRELVARQTLTDWGLRAPVPEAGFRSRVRGEAGDVVAALLTHLSGAERTLRTAFPSMWQRWVMSRPSAAPAWRAASPPLDAFGPPSWIDGVAGQLVDAAQRLITFDVFQHIGGGAPALAAAWRELPEDVASRIGGYYQALSELRQLRETGLGR